MNEGSLMPQVLKDDVREKIVETAKRLFIEKGYEKVSMSVIATEAGVAVGNIYRYFKNKDALYKHLAQPVADKLMKLFGSSFESKGQNKIETRITKFIEIYESEKSLILLLLENSINSEFQNLKEEIILGFKSAVIKWKELAIPGETSVYDSIFIKAFTTAFVNGIISIISEKVDDETKRKSLYRFASFMKDSLHKEFIIGEGNEKIT